MHRTLHRIAYAALLCACAIAAPAPGCRQRLRLAKRPSARSKRCPGCNGKWIEHQERPNSPRTLDRARMAAPPRRRRDHKGQRVRSRSNFSVSPKRPTDISYFASPNAAPVDGIQSDRTVLDQVVFENKTHDFPERVIYTKGPNGTLNARIEGMINGKLVSEDWHYRRRKITIANCVGLASVRISA